MAEIVAKKVSGSGLSQLRQLLRESHAPAVVLTDDNEGEPPVVAVTWDLWQRLTDALAKE